MKRSSVAFVGAAGFLALLGAAAVYTVVAEARTLDPRPPVAERAELGLPTILSEIRELDSARRKCSKDDSPFPDAPQLGLVIDGELVDSGDASRFPAARDFLEPDDIYSLEIICAERLYERTGIRLGNAAIVIHTKEGPVPLITRVLEELAERQDDHFERHQRYAGGFAELGWTQGEREVAVALTVTTGAAGWTASAEHEDYPFVCGVSGGDAPSVERSRMLSHVVCPAAQRARAD